MFSTSVSLPPQTEHYIATKDVLDLVCKGQYLKDWYSTIDYHSLFYKSIQTNPILMRYVVRTRDTHISDNSGNYRCLPIKADDLKVGGHSQLISSILFKKRSLYDADEINVFRTLSDKTQDLYVEHEGQFIDLLVMRKTLELILRPIIVDINLKVGYLKAYNNSNYRFNLRVDFIKGAYIKNIIQDESRLGILKPVLIANIVFKLEYAIYWCFQDTVKVGELSHDGKMELITRLTFFYPFLPSIIQVVNARPISFDEFLSQVPSTLDYGIATFLFETLTPGKNPNKDTAREIIKNNRLHTGERQISNFFAGPSKIPSVFEFKDINQLSGNYFDPHLFLIGDDNQDVMTDIDKDTVILPIETVRAAKAANKQPISYNGTFFNYVIKYLDGYQNQPYNFYFTLFFGDIDKKRSSPQKKTYSVSLPASFLDANFLPTQEAKMRSEIIASTPFDPDIRFDLSGANYTFNVHSLTIAADTDPKMNRQVTVYTFLPQQDIVLTNGRYPFSLKPFKNFAYDAQRCNKVIQLKQRRFNYTFNIFLNKLWMQTNANDFTQYKDDMTTYTESLSAYIVGVLKPQIFYLGSDIEFDVVFENLRAEQMNLVPDGLVIAHDADNIISNIEKNALIDEYLTTQFKTRGNTLQIMLRLKTAGGSSAPPEHVLICNLTKK